MKFESQCQVCLFTDKQNVGDNVLAKAILIVLTGMALRKTRGGHVRGQMGLSNAGDRSHRILGKSQHLARACLAGGKSHKEESGLV